TRAKLVDLSGAVEKLSDLMSKATGRDGDPYPILALSDEPKNAAPRAAEAPIAVSENEKPLVSQGFRSHPAERAGISYQVRSSKSHDPLSAGIACNFRRISHTTEIPHHLGIGEYTRSCAPSLHHSCTMSNVL